MSIRQIKPSPHEPPPTQLIVQVQPINVMIGDTWYATGIKITNLLSSPITVTDIKLRVKQRTYQNKLKAQEASLVVLPPGSTKAIEVWFDLDEDVRTTFQTKAELQVSYGDGKSDRSVQAEIIGGRMH